MTAKLTTFESAIAYLEGFVRSADYEHLKTEQQVYNPLQRMKKLLSLLDNPQNAYPCVVVSGTSGKGSTTQMIASMLKNAGYKTGMTLSPHLLTIQERFQINNIQIAQERFLFLVNTLRSTVDLMQESEFGSPSYFEIILGLVFLYFAQEKIDIAVVEVGLEGRFDGTNVLNPLIFVLTNISLDHTQILGNTIEEIASEATQRIGSLTSNALVITGVTQPTVWNIVKMRCRLASVGMKRLHNDFDYVIRQENVDYSLFDFQDDTNAIADIQLSLIGAYQIENASIAIEAALQLRQFHFNVSSRCILDTLSEQVIPGRFETLILGSTTLIIDGAHNPAKMFAFLQSFKRIYTDQRVTFIIAFSKGHGIEAMLAEIASVATTIIITQYSGTTDMGKQRMVPIRELLKNIKQTKLFEKITISEAKNIQKAMEKGKKIARKDNGILIVTGSLYLVGNLKELLLAERLSVLTV